MSNRHDLTLELDALVAVAIAEAGVEEFEDNSVLQRVGGIVNAYKSLGLDLAQEAIAAESILDILVTRMKVAADRKRYPEIDQEEIRQPIVVAGFARSGTTLLYSLLSADPGARSPQWWDALHPSPPPGLSPTHDDLRKQLAQRELAEFLRVVPIKAAHPYVVKGADMSLECYVLWALDFRSLAAFLYFRVPGYPQVPLGGSDDPAIDLLNTYRFEKLLLQTLQWRRPTGHWVLKDPSHHFNLPEIRQVFPDAAIVWVHRDPARVFASLIELIGIMTDGMMRKHVDRREIAKTVVPAFADQLRRALDHPILEGNSVQHVYYDELMRDPSGVIHEVYDRIGRDMPSLMRRRLDHYGVPPGNRSDLYGRFRYSLETTGYSAAEIRELFRPYIDRFDIPIDAAWNAAT